MKTFRFIQRTSPRGEIVSIPHAVVEGTRPGPSMAVVAAVHGSEYTGIEAAIRLYRDLDPNEVQGTLRMAVVANVPAFRARTMYTCPIDGNNLGTSFPGSATGNYSELLARHGDLLQTFFGSLFQALGDQRFDPLRRLGRQSV